MARVTVEDCLKRISNRFELALVANHRAKQLINGERAKIDVGNSKPVTVALREIADDLVNKDVLQEPIISETSQEQAWNELSSSALSEMFSYDSTGDEENDALAKTLSDEDPEKDDSADANSRETDSPTGLNFEDEEK